MKKCGRYRCATINKKRKDKQRQWRNRTTPDDEGESVARTSRLRDDAAPSPGKSCRRHQSKWDKFHSAVLEHTNERHADKRHQAACNLQRQRLFAETANNTVKQTCVCRTTEDRPAGIPSLMALYSRANWKAPIVKPNDTTNRIGTSGRLTKKIAGTAAKKKRRLARSSGGISLTPSLTATKLVPKTRTAISAMKISRSFIGHSTS
jgi:hypothetical protein